MSGEKRRRKKCYETPSKHRRDNEQKDYVYILSFSSPMLKIYLEWILVGMYGDGLTVSSRLSV